MPHTTKYYQSAVKSEEEELYNLSPLFICTRWVPYEI